MNINLLHFRVCAVVCFIVFGTAAAPVWSNPQLDKDSREAGNWLMYGRTYDNQRFSPLKQINTSNVKNLKVAYAVSLGALEANQSNPIVVGDTLYVTSSSGPKNVFAIDAQTGKTKWRYEPELPADTAPFACCGLNNRGVAYVDGHIFVGRLDGKLAALDAKTGAEKWVVTVVDYKEGAVITSPPLIVKDMVITGFGGGEYGVRGYIDAYDVRTGERRWRFYTTAAPGEPGGDTWKGDSYKQGGGAAWYIGSFDPQTNTVFWGTSNAAPWNASVRGPGNSEYGKFTNLYTASTLALDADTGKLKWYLQTTPHDAWDYDGVNENVLADLTIGGKKVPVLMKADRNGFFYVADRKSGKLISADPFVHVNWATGVDLSSARPIEVPEMRPSAVQRADSVCPHIVGAKNWMPMAFNPQTGLVYMSVNNICFDMKGAETEYKRGQLYLGVELLNMRDPAKGGPDGAFVAWDPVARKRVWSIPEKFFFNGGAMTTAGNLVFHGDMEGNFRANDAKSGEELWRFYAGSGIQSGPMTFSVNGKQYVAVVAGRSASIASFWGDKAKSMVKQTAEGGMLFVFSM